MEAPNHKVRVALFDVCNTLVDVTTITDFTFNFLLSLKHNKNIKIRYLLKYYIWRLKRKLRISDPASSRKYLFNLFKGYSEEDLAPLLVKYTDRLKSLLKMKVVETLKELESKGYKVILVSAGLDVYLKPFARFLNAELIASNLEKDDGGIYTGKLKGIDCIGEGKVEKIKSELPYHGNINWEESYAFSDSYSDIPLLSIVAHPFVVNPDYKLRRYANQKGWGMIDAKIKEGASVD